MLFILSGPVHFIRLRNTIANIWYERYGNMCTVVQCTYRSIKGFLLLVLLYSFFIFFILIRLLSITVIYLLGTLGRVPASEQCGGGGGGPGAGRLCPGRQVEWSDFLRWKIGHLPSHSIILYDPNSKISPFTVAYVCSKAKTEEKQQQKLFAMFWS